MWVQSDKGRGTSFFFSLPVDEALAPVGDNVLRWFSPYAQHEARERRSTAPAIGIRPRLIVVETDNALQRLLVRYLNTVEIAPVTTLEEAAAEIARAPAQALLMNNASMSDVLRQINLSNVLPYGLPAIVCSVPGIHDLTSVLGFYDYLVKPVGRDALLRVLQSLDLPNRTVLVVDDDPDALLLFRRMLISATVDRGYRVLRASNGRQALQLLRDNHPDVVLLDLIMPEMDGYQLLAEMKQDPQICTIPVVAISAQDPAGQPILSASLAVSCGGGIPIHRLLSTIESLMNTLSPQQVNLGIQRSQEGGAAKGFAQEGRSA